MSTLSQTDGQSATIIENSSNIYFYLFSNLNYILLTGHRSKKFYVMTKFIESVCKHLTFCVMIKFIEIVLQPLTFYVMTRFIESVHKPLTFYVMIKFIESIHKPLTFMQGQSLLKVSINL